MTEEQQPLPLPLRTAAEMTAKGHERLRYWAGRVRKMIDLNAPDGLLAHTVMCLYRCASGHLTDSVQAELLKQWRAEARRYVGLCALCDAEAAPPHHELCPACEAAESELFARYEREEEDRK